MDPLITSITSQYTDGPLTHSQSIMRNFPFYSAFTFILLSALVVSAKALTIASTHPAMADFFALLWLPFSCTFSVVGVGFSFPVIIVASSLGWGQLGLLLTGNIHPHLGGEGFFNVLKIVFSKI